MTLGFLGLYFEFQSPGAVLPGVVGAICLVLAFMALSVLPVNYAGILLLLLAGVFFIAEIKVTSYRPAVGRRCHLAGARLHVALQEHRSGGAGELPASSISLVLTAIAVVWPSSVTLAIRTHRSPVETGSEGLLQETGVAKTDVASHGKVFIHGELWNATGGGRRSLPARGSGSSPSTA